MKKIFVLVFIGVLFILVGCDSNNTSTKEPSVEEENSQPTNEQNPDDLPTNEQNPDDNPTVDEPKYTMVTDLVLDEERIYTGQVVDNIPNGEGTLTWVLTNCVYEGEFVDGKYEGEGTFYWNNVGDSLVGTWSDGNPISGKYTYKNTMAYEGEFNSAWQFHGQGKFDWNTYNEDGSVKSYGWLYEGGFFNGSPAGCVGKITFTNARDGSNGEGVQWFEGVMDGFPNIKKDQFGKGKIKFGDNSVYEGDIQYTANGEWFRVGYGVMDFSNCNFAGDVAGGTPDSKLLRYEGQFDHYKTGWMFGNGVMYFTDSMGNPTYYIKGFYSALAVIKEYEGTLNLFDGYDESMERKYLFNYSYMQNYINSKYPQSQQHDAIICGDSYTDMMHSHFNIMNFDTAFNGYDVIDTGIGGTTYYQWRNLAEYLIIPYNPSKVVLHLGFNDLHMGLSAEETLAEADKLIKELKEALPGVEIVLMTVEPSPTFANFLAEETKYNNLLKEYCTTNGITLIDHAALLLNNGQPVSNLKDYFINDGVHLNAAGYERFVNLIKEKL